MRRAVTCAGPSTRCRARAELGLIYFSTANPGPVLNGALRKGIAEAGKTGWVSILDRATGTPLLGMKETAVMQLPQQHTSPTQPLAGGTALGGSKRSDGLWLLSLDGTLKSLPRGAADPAAAPRPAGAAAASATNRAPDLAKGKDLYTTTCIVCHGYCLPCCSIDWI